jgi:hypothetical protein
MALRQSLVAFSVRLRRSTQHPYYKRFNLITYIGCMYPPTGRHRHLLEIRRKVCIAGVFGVRILILWQQTKMEIKFPVSCLEIKISYKINYLVAGNHQIIPTYLL